MSRKTRARRSGGDLHRVSDVPPGDEVDSEPRTSSAPVRGRGPGPLPTPETTEEVEEPNESADQDA